MRKINLDKEIVFFILIIFIIIVEFFLLLFTIRYLFNLNRKITDIKKTIETTKREKVLLDSYNLKIQNLKKDLELFNNKSVGQAEVSSLLSFISSESKKFNIDINKITPLPKTKYITSGENKFSYIPISIEAIGNFHNLTRFLEYLQDSNYFFDVTELNINYSDGIESINMVICGLLKEQ